MLVRTKTETDVAWAMATPCKLPGPPVRTNMARSNLVGGTLGHYQSCPKPKGAMGNLRTQGKTCQPCHLFFLFILKSLLRFFDVSLSLCCCCRCCKAGAAVCCIRKHRSCSHPMRSLPWSSSSHPSRSPCSPSHRTCSRSSITVAMRMTE